MEDDDVNGDRQLIMGEGIHFHIRDELWDDAAMRVHMDRYHPIGRMSRTATAAPTTGWNSRQHGGAGQLSKRPAAT